MSEAAEAVSESSEAAEAPQAEFSDPAEQEMPSFNIYEEAEPEPQSAEGDSVSEKPVKEEAEKESWSAKIKRDRAQRKKEIELKKKEQELSQKEIGLSSAQQMRDAFIKNPEEFLQNQGIDPMEFFADWTNRISTGINEPTENTRLSSTERQVKELQEELQRRDRERLEKASAQQQQQAIEQYYSQIDNFVKSTDDYPLTKEQCSSQDIAQGIAAYYQKTGVELGFDEACKMIEDGLVEKETNIFNDPSIIAKFKKYHNLDASNNKGRRSQVTLSSNLQTQPTKTPAEDMTDDEIHEFWKGKLFT